MATKPNIPYPTYYCIPDTKLYPQFQQNELSNPMFLQDPDYFPIYTLERKPEYIQYILSMIETNLPDCLVNMDKDYVHGLLQEPDRCVLYLMVNNVIEGIAIFRHLSEESIYNDIEGNTIDVPVVKIDVLCGSSRYRGAGTKLVEQVSRICRVVGVRYITLNSLTEAVPFYLKTGFECVGECKLQMKTRKEGGRRKTRRHVRRSTLKYRRRHRVRRTSSRSV